MSQFMLGLRWSIALSTAALILCAIPLTAQPIYREWRDSTLPPEKSLYGYENGMFPTILYTYRYDYSKPITEAWPYFNGLLGCNTLVFENHRAYETMVRRFDSLADGNDRPPNTRLIASGTRAEDASRGREIQFYTYDSSQGRKWGLYECRFLQVLQREPILNSAGASQVDQEPQEVHYFPSDVEVDGDTIIATNLAYGWKPSQTSRFKKIDTGGIVWRTLDDSLVINSHAMSDQITSSTLPRSGGLYYLNVRGHLLDGDPTVADTVALLQIIVYYEIDSGSTYRRFHGPSDDSVGAGFDVVANTNLRLPYDTVYVLRGSLKPLDDFSLDRYSKYRDTSIALNLRRVDSLSGPVYATNTARNFDLEVKYLGGEALAVRSIAIRDSMGQRMLGNLPADSLARDSLAMHIRQSISSPDSTFRPHVVGIAAADELPPSAYACTKRLNEIITDIYKQVIPPGLNPTDTVGVYLNEGIPHEQYLGTVGFVSPQVYPTPIQTYADPMHSPLPSDIRQRNGGRLGIPLLFDIESLLDSSFTSLQEQVELYTYSRQQRLGRNSGVDNISVREEYPYHTGIVFKHSLNARAARATGVPYLPLVATTRILSFLTHANGTTDTIFQPQRDAATARRDVNLALCYGAHGLFWWFGFEPRIAPLDLGLNDSLSFHQDGGGIGANFYNPKELYSYKYYHKLTNDTFHLEGLYVGETDRRNTMRWLNTQWLNHDTILGGNTINNGIGPILRRWRWRDAYSIHYQVEPDYTPVSGDIFKIPPPPRPLPSTEIVTEVKSRPITDTTWDAPARTFVEVGLFETKMYKDSNGVRNPMRDSNAIFVLNRRSFETPTDSISATILDPGNPNGPAIKARLDSLSETRIIRLKLNLGHPDTTRYAFIRVRDVFPDKTPLPLIGQPTPLDTVLAARDSSITLVLGAGRAAFLEITYEPPQESIVNAFLPSSGQRKLIFDGSRYHAMFQRWDSVANDFHIYYQNSLLISDTMQSILWDPASLINVSDDTFVNPSDNQYPSMTLRYFNIVGLPDTIIMATWSAHRDNTSRYILARNLNITKSSNSPISIIDNHLGANPNRWGTPVISREDGGEIFVYSDSLMGIVGRVRRLGSGLTWWMDPPTLSPLVNISHNSDLLCPDSVGRFPTVPAFAHIASLDSNIGISWLQPACDVPGHTNIMYARLEHLDNGTLTLRVTNVTPLTPFPGYYHRPSMDQIQDVWHRVFEGVTWEEDAGGAGSSKIHFRSLFTETHYGAYGDSIEPTSLWDWATLFGAGKAGDAGDNFPSTASLNDVMTEADIAANYSPDSTEFYGMLFSVAYHRFHVQDNPQSTLRQAVIRFNLTSFKDGFPHVYAYLGRYPSTSASPLRQLFHQAILYRTTDAVIGDSIAQTSRQFFGFKLARPTGYIAEGRQAIIRINDSARTGVVLAMNDPWFATADGGQGLDMVKRDTTFRRVDSLPQVHTLLRTKTFTAHDTTAIGLEVSGQLYGDSTAAGSTRISVIAELVNATTDEVVQQLDSFAVSATTEPYEVVLEPEYDLLSGTYYIRVRLDTSNLPFVSATNDSRYPVAEVAGYVEHSGLNKLRRVSLVSEAKARLSAQPNPLTNRTEIRFSIPERDYVTVTVYDQLGREIARPLEHTIVEAGRFAIDLDGSRWTPGTYLVELRAGRERVVEKVVVVR